MSINLYQKIWRLSSTSLKSSLSMTCANIRKGVYLRNWTLDEEKLLTWVVNNYCQSRSIDSSALVSQRSEKQTQNDWVIISTMVPSRNFAQCRYKWNSGKLSNSKKNYWISLEDDTLHSLVEKLGLGSWTKIAVALSATTGIVRSGKQCRERWQNHLAPVINRYEYSDHVKQGLDKE